ncbi:MAG TPA: hypothetical protein VF190_13105 [Rhodothermales bacterium]
MSSQIFVNLPVKDLNRSVEFFTKLGYSFNPQFTDENATSMIISEHIYVMLLVEPYFKQFTDKEISDARKSTEVILALPLENREAVDAFIAKAVTAGATTPRPAVDLGFMYTHAYEDLDGHMWEVFYMDTSAMPQE